MDLSKLSDADLQALAGGDMSKVSDDGLRLLAGQPAGPKKLGTVEQRKELAQGARLQLANPLSAVGIGPSRIDLGVDLPQGPTEFLAGMGRRFMDIGTLGNRSTRNAEADAALDSSLNATLGGATADLATLVGGGAVIRGASALPMVPRVAQALQTVGQSMMAPQSVKAAATTAGLYGAATTNGDLGDRAAAGGVNALFGAAGQAIPIGIGRLVSPKGTPQANALRQAGVELTPGQALGGRWEVAEQKATSIPLVGDMVANARNKATESFNVAAVNKALEPIGAKVGPTVKAGRDLINAGDDLLEREYSAIVPKLATQYDQALDQGIGTAKRIAAGANKADQFDAIIGDKVLSRFNQQNQLTGDALKQAESELKRLARQYQGSLDADQKQLGEALLAARDALMQNAAKYSPADAVKALSKADLAYAQFLRIEGAAGMRGAKEGVFTPAQLSSSVRSQSRGPRKAEYAKGNALMQDFANSAESGLGNFVPDSGTAGRLMLGAGLMGGAAYMDPTYALPAATLAALYTPAGQATLRTLMAPRTNPLLLRGGNALEQLAPYGGLGAPALIPAIYAGQQ